MKNLSSNKISFYDNTAWVYTGGWGGAFMKGLKQSFTGINSMTDTHNYYIYENQRWNPLSGYTAHGLPTDRHSWSDITGKHKRSKEHTKLLSIHWQWVSDSLQLTMQRNSSPIMSDVVAVIPQDSNIMDSPITVWAVAANGNALMRKVWVVGKNGAAYFWYGITTENPQGDAWQQIESPSGVLFKQISAGKMGVWALDATGSLAVRREITATFPEGSHWQMLANVPSDPPHTEGTVGFKAISVGDEVWAISNSGFVCERCGITKDQPAGTGWNLGINLRVDFQYFDLDQPTASRRPYASCEGDRLSINGLSFELCGKLVNQHVYVPFDVQRLTDELVLDFQIGSNKFAIWNMDVNQIECSHKAALVTPDERQAPDGCLQYFYQTSGVVQSFNFGHNYYGNTQYAICFNRNYNPNAILELTDIEFNMDGNLAGGAPDGFDSDCLDPTGAAPNNKKDYISIPFATVTNPTGPSVVHHSLFCLQSIDSKLVEFSGTGPMVIHVNTDQITEATANEEGFRFQYQVRRR
ncbi:hypothetical protein HA402_001411 [Bradysia odoriphaga]|nr:hypothetical protein HA402_001411 [Bradysia odoriphaga]